MKALEYVFYGVLVASLVAAIVARSLGDDRGPKNRRCGILRPSSREVLWMSVVLGLVGIGGLWLLIATHVTK